MTNHKTNSDLVKTETEEILHRISNIKSESIQIKERFIERMKTFSIGILNKNTLSTVAAIAALKDQEHVHRSVENTREGKTYLYHELERMGYAPLKTQTIFVTVEVGPNAEILIDRLAEMKVRVRKAFDMEGFMRISVGLPRENEAFISAFKQQRNAL